MNKAIRDLYPGVLAQRLLDAAFSALHDNTQIQGAVQNRSAEVTSHYQPDATVVLSFEGRCYPYVAECKTIVDRKTQLDQIDLRRRQIDAPFMLVASYISKELASHCKTIGLQFIDTHGNAYLQAPGMYIYITGQKVDQPHHYEKAPRALTNPAALRIVFALLSKPELVQSTLKALAAISGVSVGTAYNVLGELMRRGYLIADTKNSRKLLEPRRLAEEWIINFPFSLRSKLNSYRFTCADPFWWENTDITAFQASWGSEVAATKILSHLKPASQTIYVDTQQAADVISTLVRKYRFKPDPQGQIEILERFWSPLLEPQPGIAPPLVVYADLIGLLDPRAKETAQLIMEKYLEY